jgi:hypothetical protein
MVYQRGVCEWKEPGSLNRMTTLPGSVYYNFKSPGSREVSVRLAKHRQPSKTRKLDSYVTPHYQPSC